MKPLKTPFEKILIAALAAIIAFLLYVIKLHGEAKYLEGFYEAKHLQKYDISGNLKP